jgi:hypothetical protein
MQTIYLKTSIICHLTDPPSTNPITRACQQLTQLWWHTRCDPANTFVSKYVLEEIKRDDPLRATRRLRSIQRLVSHANSSKASYIAELLIGGGGLKAKSLLAAEHIACAAQHNCEILLTWNCVDIANAQNFPLMRMLMDVEDLVLPELVTPFELMENSYETLW